MAMRLLAVSDNGRFIQERFAKDSIPRYAILSHRWSTREDDEITFKEITEGICDKEKPGYNKLQFCSGQAKADGLNYFWVDTCCIDQSDQNELSVAIYSMFRWYQKADKCYVYLADVAEESTLSKSEWFSRGWTLQELLAPEIVDFYTRDGVRLGDKSSLEQQIAEITDIPIDVLRGRSLSRFPPEEIISWVERRHTKEAEDKAYCLLGVFNVSMLLEYGEGERKAFSRLYKEIENRVPDMDGLLKDLSYAADAPFHAAKWQHEPTCLPDTRVQLQQQIHDWIDGNDQRTIFWLNGLAGTGKSTIARTIAHNCFQQGRLGASFFFSKGSGDISHARKFFTTIAAQLCEESQYLKRCIYDAIKENKTIATQSYANQWRQLILGPLSKLDKGYRPFSFVFVIDAMDECESDADITLILRLLVEAQLLKKVRLRVFLTSRPEIPIQRGFNKIPNAKRQDFILHNIPPLLIDHDIALFLKVNFEQIRDELHLEAEWPGNEVIEKLVRSAGSLFIWAATACRFVREGKRFAADRLSLILKEGPVDTSAADFSTDDSSTDGSAIEDLATAPDEHLNRMYITVLEHSARQYTNQEKKKLYKVMRQTLGGIILLFSPLPTLSLASLLNVQGESFSQTLDGLHSILDIPKDASRPLRLHHPSFRDFLLTKDRCSKHFYVDERQLHQVLADSCIRLMSQTLKKDICEMHAPGSQASQVESSWIEKCLPPEVQYACLYWIQHLQRSGFLVYDGEEAHRFLQAHLLHWLEALGWIGKASEGIQAILSLEAYVPVNESPNLHAFIHDAKRFALYNRSVIEQAPLQLYCSALVFAPGNSIVRRQFKDCIPDWIQLKPKMQAHWNAVLQTLKGHTGSVSTGAPLQTLKGHTGSVSTGAPLQTVKGHTGSISSVAFSPDGKQVVSGSDDGTVRLWDAATGAPLQALRGHISSISSMAFSPDGKQVVSGSDDRTVRLWDAATGAPLQMLKDHTSSISSVAFSPDGKQVVSGSDDRTVRLWDAATGAPLQALKGHTGSISLVAFSPDGKQVVSGSCDQIVRLWDTATGAPLQTLKGHISSISSVAFSPDGKQVVSGSCDRIVRLWDVATGVPLQTLKGHTGSISSVAFSPDGKQVVSGSGDQIVRLWDVVTGAPLQTLESHTGSISSVAFSPDGKQVVSGLWDRIVRLWDAAIKVSLQTLKGHTGSVSTGAPLQTLKGHTGSVSSVAFSPDGKQVVSGSCDRTVRLWDAATGAPLQTLRGHTGSISSVAFSPDGKHVVSGSGDGTVRLWDAATGALLQTPKGHTGSVSTGAPLQTLKGHTGSVSTGAPLQALESHTSPISLVAFSPDGKQVVSRSNDGTVRLWDAATGAPLQTLEGYTSSISSIAFSPDGKQVVSGLRDRTVRLWDTATGIPLQTLEGHTGSISSMAFSPDGKQVVSGSDDRTVRLWDAVTGAPLQMLKDHIGSISSVAFSPDGKQVVSGSDDRTMRLWDAVTGAPLQALKGHTNSISSMAFSPDSKQVVSGSDDRTVRLWDAVTGAPLQTLRGHIGSISSVAFSPDSKHVVSGSGDGTVRLWDAATGALLQTLEGHNSSVSSMAFSPDGKLLPILQVSNHWVVEDNTNILWLPPNYQETCSVTWNKSLLIGHSSGRISFFCFKKGAKLVM